MRTKGGRFFPEYIVQRPIWILWRIESNEKGQKTKVPYCGHRDGKASSTDPDTWTTFDRAVDKLVRSRGYYNGVGIAIDPADMIVFIDIDHCIDSSGAMTSDAEKIVSRMNGQFIEVSQSGEGLHILALGEIPRNFNNRKYGVEMYNKGRFVAMTGHAISECEPAGAQTDIADLFNKYATAVETPIERRNAANRIHDDDWVIDHAMKQELFRDLYKGEWGNYDSHSHADLALCGQLAFWTDCNPDQMDRLFRKSGLYRRKWDRRDYSRRTINMAIRNCRRTFSEYAR